MTQHINRLYVVPTEKLVEATGMETKGYKLKEKTLMYQTRKGYWVAEPFAHPKYMNVTVPLRSRRLAFVNYKYSEEQTIKPFKVETHYYTDRTQQKAIIDTFNEKYIRAQLATDLSKHLQLGFLVKLDEFDDTDTLDLLNVIK